jgi:hypothetical protein
MKHEDIHQELHDLARQLGVTIRYEKGDFEGGYCILRENRLLLVNRKLQLSKKISILARGLNEIGLEDIFVKPALRHYIEDEVAKTAATHSPAPSTPQGIPEP